MPNPPSPPESQPVENPYIVCGVSFRYTPVSLREQISISTGSLPAALRFVGSQPGVRECVVLSTCNRPELYLAAEPWLEPVDLLVRFAGALGRLADPLPAEQIYVHRGPDAVAHLFRVA